MRLKKALSSCPAGKGNASWIRCVVMELKDDSYFPLLPLYSRPWGAIPAAVKAQTGEELSVRRGKLEDVNTETLLQGLAGIVGTENMRAGEGVTDPRLPDRWRHGPLAIVAPGTAEEIATLVRQAEAE